MVCACSMPLLRLAARPRVEMETRRVDFYHLTRDPAPVVAARLAERACASGACMLVVAGDRSIREAADAALWTTAPESFVPHALAGGRDEAAEPVLIADRCENPANGATMTALIDGIWDDATLAFERTFYLFDGERIDDARAAWRGLSRRDDVNSHYWRQDADGRWREGP